MGWVILAGFITLFVVLYRSATNARYQSQRSGKFYDRWEDCEADELGVDSP